jgi:hypothetical protein
MDLYQVQVDNYQPQTERGKCFPPHPPRVSATHALWIRIDKWLNLLRLSRKWYDLVRFGMVSGIFAV